MGFKDRVQAAQLLTEHLLKQYPNLSDSLVLGIPRGGVPIGCVLADRFGSDFDILVSKKLPTPYSPETGFGAVTLDKVIVLNEDIFSSLDLDKSSLNEIIDQAYKEVLRRSEVYRADKEFPSLDGRTVVLTDDGLATGYTMFAAAKFCKSKNAKRIIVGCPVSYIEAYNIMNRYTDDCLVLHVSQDTFFAVSAFYKEFPQLTDMQVLNYIKHRP